MRTRWFVLLFVVLLLAFGASAENCYRQNINRAGTSPPAGTLSIESNPGNLLEFVTNVGGYDYVFYPNAKLRFTAARTFAPVKTRDDGTMQYGARQPDFVALWEGDNILATNVAGNKGPLASEYPACFWKNDTNTQCYFIWGSPNTYIPANGDCHKKLNENGNPIKMGVGSGNSITYDLNETGPKSLMLKIGAATVQTQSPNNLNRVMYLPLSDRKLEIFVGYPSLLAFGQEDVKTIASFENTGSEDINLYFTLANKSLYNETLVDYSPNCSSGVNCTVEVRDNGEKLYKDFKLSADNNAMIIKVIAHVDRTKSPQSFVAYLDLTFSADGISDCSPGEPSPYCVAKSSPMKINFGLLDQQDFQVEARTAAAAEMAACVGPEGIVGQTGESVVPRINLSFGGAADPAGIISVDECDPKSLDDSDNSDWVYCSQKEFLVELAEKIGEVAEIRTEIASLESAGLLTEAQLKRQEEGPYLGFKAAVRKQTLSKSSTSDTIETIIPTLLQNLGLPSIFVYEDKFTTQQKLLALFNEAKFKLLVNGIETDSLEISPGIYRVRIDMNELAANTSPNYLFLGGQLTPELELTITLEKDSNPEFDWFFYNREGDDAVMLFVDAQTQKIPTFDNYVTNFSNRGAIIEFSTTSAGSITAKNFYTTFAVPLFIRIGKTPGGTKNSFTTTGFSSEGHLNPLQFSYWTGFASSLGNGCEDITTTGGALPYLLPDSKVAGSTTDNFELKEYNSTKSDQNTYLETVVYLPNNAGSSITLAGPLNIYWKGGSCTTASSGGANCTFIINKSETSFVIPADQVNPTNSLHYVFNSIKDSNVCVYQEPNPTGGTKWVLFWNEQKILKELSARKSASIKDATLCAAREEILGTN